MDGFKPKNAFCKGLLSPGMNSLENEPSRLIVLSAPNIDTCILVAAIHSSISGPAHVWPVVSSRLICSSAPLGLVSTMLCGVKGSVQSAGFLYKLPQ